MTRLGATVVVVFALAVPQARAADDCAKLRGPNVVAVPGITVVARPFSGGGERGTVFQGCRKPHGPVYRLGRTTTRVGSNGEEEPAAGFRVLQAQTTGLLVEQIEGGRRTVDLVETRGGMRTPIEGAGVPRPAAQKLVLATSGVVAGVFADDPQRTDSPNPGETLVLAIAGSGPGDQQLLDFARATAAAGGPAIPPDALRVEGSVVHWTRDGVARSKQLTGRPPRPPRRRAGARCRSLRGRDLAKGSSRMIKIVERRIDRDNTALIGCVRPKGPRYTLAHTDNEPDSQQDEGGYVASSSIEANWFGGTFVGVRASSFADTAIEESSSTSYSIVDVRNGAESVLLAYDQEDDEKSEEARIKYDKRGVALMEGDKNAGFVLGVFTASGWQYMDRSPEPLTDLAIKDGVVSWKRAGEPQSRAIAGR
jgi:hypothetical protein